VERVFTESIVGSIRLCKPYISFRLIPAATTPQKSAVHSLFVVTSALQFVLVFIQLISAVYEVVVLLIMDA
jgi:hypothetical protein